jgi:DNA repair protein SbcC/Rad50
MRLHHLSVTAFGPFVDAAEVDFEALCDAGLFLLSGATGAGKSSVLDAVCFALYGAVPGDRQEAGRLRSDQAPPGLVPQVTLEVSLSGRRFHIVRSPAWERPKRRGTGTTREQARVTVTERIGDASVPLTSRLDEAGDLLSSLLGMNLEQFCRVALLPQGHFQAFLRAKPDERQRLLARLFRTGRFDRMELWLREHRLSLRRTSDAQARAVGDLLSRVSEAANLPVPDHLADVHSAAYELAGWVAQVRDHAEVRRRTAAAELAGALTEEQAAQQAAITAHELDVARTRVATAAETVERLDRERDVHAGEALRLEHARRAEGVRPLTRLVDERQALLEQAAARADSSLIAAAAAGLDTGDLPAELQRLTDELAALATLLPAEQRLVELFDRQAAHAEELQALKREGELAAAEAVSLRARIRDLEDDLVLTETAARALTGAESVAAGLRAAVAAHAAVQRLVVDLDAAQSDHAAARGRLVDLREEQMDLRERRIAGMAAELAGALVVGSDCPVCGSPDHPHPARAGDSHPDAEAERSAQRAVDDAQAIEHALHLRVRDLEAALTPARAAAADTDPDGLAAALEAADQTLARLRTDAERRDAVRTSLGEARACEGAITEGATTRRVRMTELTTSLRHLQQQAAELDSRVTAARGEHSQLSAAVAELSSRREAVGTVQAHLTALEVARTSHADSEVALRRAVIEAGFAASADARDAELPADALTTLEARVQEHRTALAAAREVLDQPDAWALLTESAPELDLLDATAHAAGEALERCRSADQLATRTAERVGRLVDELEAALAEWAPLRERLALATSMSAFAEGKAPDNRLQMRLSAYVIAFRLSQVVTAANARLAGMSDQRYTLEHVGRRGAGETRGGLSLVVRDDWSGESRDPATLSGGETFVVSLALALGLADVVTHESGGADLQTLFVDEGFGSLDAETLDDVLDILDSLRENGRAVGVVSHVAEMRDRIPTQLVVTKSRAGSSLRVVGRPG